MIWPICHIVLDVFVQLVGPTKLCRQSVCNRLGYDKLTQYGVHVGAVPCWLCA